ncbi:hypothetical protein GBAR_LOCUS6545 [Geodia barretti]|uniref:Uncharacterized protein n=1 Tax=Geodia barretti TaxID=519541 RepID=A0AA35RE53_GEOBA|nr:hypothetical protein GBAR_LOCUS6545 [Geodia barretti]
MAAESDASDGRPKSGEDESGFSQPESETPDSSESIPGCVVSAMEETRLGSGQDSLCSGKPVRAHTGPVDPLHSGAAKSTPHTAPHLRMPQLETYEPTHKDSNPIATEETTDSQSPPAAEPADGPSGACGGNPDNPDPSVPSSDDVLADDNNRVTDSPVDGGNAFVMFHFTSLLSLVFFLQR